MNNQHVPCDVAESSEASDLLTSDEYAPRSFGLAARSLAIVLCMVIPIGFWFLVVNWSTRYARQDLEKQDRPLEVKPIEIRQVDIDFWRKTVGIPED